MNNPQVTQKQYGKEPNYELQPDYQLSQNGYGLLQLSANFDVDSIAASSSANVFYRGAALPTGAGPLYNDLSRQTWTLVKCDEVGRDGNLTKVRAMYAAIDKIICPGGTSQTEAVITSTAVSEPIESHPNFSVIQIPKIADNGQGTAKGKPLGGEFTNGSPPIIQNDPDPKNPLRAYWVSGSSTPGVFPWQFTGFLPCTDNATPNIMAGVKSWFRPTITMRLTAYTDSADTAAHTAQRVGYIIENGDNGYGCFVIPDVYMKLVNDDPLSDGKRNWLVTGTNVEVYGGLYKVTADLILSGVLGWNPDIYPLYSRV